MGSLPADGKSALERSSAKIRMLLNPTPNVRSEEHTSELQSRLHLVCRLLLEKKKYASLHRSTSAAMRAWYLPMLVSGERPLQSPTAYSAPPLTPSARNRSSTSTVFPRASPRA